MIRLTGLDSWDEDEGDGQFIYEHVSRDAAQSLINRLKRRIDLLATPDMDVILNEIRCQMAEAVVMGDLALSTVLADLAFDLLQLKEHRRDA